MASFAPIASPFLLSAQSRPFRSLLRTEAAKGFALEPNNVTKSWLLAKVRGREGQRRNFLRARSYEYDF